MATFELNAGAPAIEATGEAALGTTLAESVGCKRRDDCLISFKVYDSCKIQCCLGYDELGAARAAENVCIGGHNIQEGEIIIAPDDAASVTVDHLKAKKTIILKKRPNPFKAGYWDVDLKFVFEYELTFREPGGEPIEPRNIRAFSTFNKKLTLFGAPKTDIVVSTDLFSRHSGETAAFDADPFVLTETKAVGLTADLKHRHHHDGEKTVAVTIGLFTIIKLFRIVQLIIETKGFCVPKECPEPPKPCNPCELFGDLEFPIDIFVPESL